MQGEAERGIEKEKKRKKEQVCEREKKNLDREQRSFRFPPRFVQFRSPSDSLLSSLESYEIHTEQMRNTFSGGNRAGVETAVA